jgi:RNA polymerase sigma-70 factor (ECF subfamily)
MDRFDPTKPFYPWLYRIVKNTCFNHLKKKKRGAETSLEKLMESGYDARDMGPNPEDVAELGELKRSLRLAMEQLTEDQREIIRLRHFLELSYSEIAERLEIPQGTVMSRLHGARKRLRGIVEDATEAGVNN